MTGDAHPVRSARLFRHAKGTGSFLDRENPAEIKRNRANRILSGI